MSGALTADIVMGLTGSGKSCLAATYAHYVWSRHKKVTLYYALDPGGVPSIVRRLADMGIIRLWRVRTRDPDERLDMAQGTLKKAVGGYWPRTFTNASTGECAPGAELVPPITTKFRLLCPNGHFVKGGTVDAQLEGAFICQDCRVNTSRANGTVEVENFVSPGFEDIGGRVFDGLTSACEWIMSDLRRRGADIDKGALKSPLKLSSDGLVFGANSEVHYGFAQNLAEDLLKSSAQIPGLIMSPLWTANEKLAVDKQTRETLVGPEISGQARTLAVPRWCGNLLGSVCLDVKDEGSGEVRKEWRLYLRQYVNPLDGLPRACKTRFSPSIGNTLPESLSDGPTTAEGLPLNKSEPFTQFSLKTFYELEENALKRQLEQEIEGYQDVPKAPEVYGETGEGKEEGSPVVVATTSPAASPPVARGKRRARPPSSPPPPMAQAPSTSSTVVAPPGARPPEPPSPPTTDESKPKPPAPAAARPPARSRRR